MFKSQTEYIPGAGLTPLESEVKSPVDIPKKGTSKLINMARSIKLNEEQNKEGQDVKKQMQQYMDYVEIRSDKK